MTLDRQPLIEQLLPDETPTTDEALAALCRQIDVRKALDGGTGGAAVAAARLLRRAATTPNSPDPFGMKCVNSALKALDLHDVDAEPTPALRAWALELLDTVGTPVDAPVDPPERTP